MLHFSFTVSYLHFVRLALQLNIDTSSIFNIIKIGFYGISRAMFLCSVFPTGVRLGEPTNRLMSLTSIFDYYRLPITERLACYKLQQRLPSSSYLAVSLTPDSIRLE